jgi:diadenosine tetraphosphate (Ap4A) HIT family hydrolase
MHPVFVAPDADAFRHLFARSLAGMLSPEQAGACILVLANSLQDAGLHNELKAALRKNFTEIQQGIRQGGLDITGDDLAVFKAIENAGVESLPCWQQYSFADWELVYNPMRALRPARASSETIDSIRQPFDAARFNFNKPFLRPEILWQGDWCGVDLRVLYNKFPFAPCHLIVVPDPDVQMPQYLTAEYHALIWDLLAQQQGVLPGLAVGYNSLGACASVNHLHFQSIVREQPLPIERDKWKHNGGSDVYPMRCHVFESKPESWRLLEKFHADNQAYNLFYRPGRCYVIPRRLQGDERVAPRVRGAGWIEECGVFSISSLAELETVTATEIEESLRSLSAY